MPALTHLIGPAAALIIANINTDTIAPMYRPAQTGKPRGFAFAEFDAVGKGDDVCEFGAAWWRLAFGNAGLVGAGVAKIAKRLQRDASNLFHRRAETILHRILLVVGRALVTAGVTAQKVYSLRLVGEGFKLERKRLAALQEFQLFRMTESGQQQDCER